MTNPQNRPTQESRRLDQLVLRLRAEGLTWKQIACTIGLSPERARQRAFRGAGINRFHPDELKRFIDEMKKGIR